MTNDFAKAGEHPDGRQYKRRPPSLRAQLLLSVNTVMAVATAVFLFLDYQQEIRSRIRQQQGALTEEARTVLYAVLHFQDHSRLAIQNYIDAVCASMRNDQSPGHHIAVLLNRESLQALTHDRASPDMLSALEKASLAQDHQSELGEETLVVGSAKQGTAVVYVAENLSNVRSMVLKGLIWRLGAVVLLAGLAAAMVNMVLLRLVARPVERLARTIGRIALGSTGVQTNGFNTAELTTLAEAINSMSRSLDEAECERRVHLAKARRIQEHLLPCFAAIPGVQIAHIYRPAADVAGDYFDIVQRSDHTLVLCIADVSGHGIAAALEAAVLKSLFLHATETECAPERVLGHINRRFVAVSLPEDFATMFVARWHPRTGLLEYASAGHETAYLLSQHGVREELASTGPPLGIEACHRWKQKAATAKSGDRLILVTDGLAETAGVTGVTYGRERLRDLICKPRDTSVAAVVREIESTLLAHRGERADTDDTTVVALEFEVVAEAEEAPATSAVEGQPCDDPGGHDDPE